jgi:hypothetical protein
MTDKERERANAYVEGKVAAAMRRSTQDPANAGGYSTAISLLRAMQPSLLGGKIDEIVYGLRVVKTTLQELQDGLHMPDDDKIEGRIIPYNEEPQV